MNCQCMIRIFALNRMWLTQVFGHAKVQHHLQDRAGLVLAETYLFNFHQYALTYNIRK